MSLKIKNGETHRVVRELAELTGESPTAAVTRAVVERLNRVKASEDVPLVSRLMEIGKDCAVRLSECEKAADHGVLL